MRHNRTIAGLMCSALIATSGCSPTGAPSTAPTSAGAQHVGSQAAPAWPAEAPDAWLLVGRRNDPGLHVIRASTGESTLDLPVGAAARADWLHMIAASPVGPKTTVRDIAVQPGLGGPELTIDGAWRLPTIGYDPVPVGLSADGSTAVIVEATPAPEVPAAVSRFAILNIAPLEGPPQVIELPGLFEFDAISSDGKVLYVVEHLPGDGSPYQVRAIDLPAGTMRATVITDKRNLGEAMAGWPIAQLRAPNGIVLTLYGGLEHPFIHALNTTEAWAVCIDLPAAHVENQEAWLHWGLAATPDWETVYAANAALGVVSVVDAAELKISRSASVGPVGEADRTLAARSPAITLAKFGHQEGGPVGRRTVVAPDGKTAYAAGPTGFIAIQTKDLTITARLLEGSSVDTLGLTPDGRAIFALLGATGRIVMLDAASGAVLGNVPGKGFDRLLAVVGW